MKFFAIILLAIMPLLDASDQVGKDVSTALNKGDAKTIGKFMMSSVDLTIIDDEDTFARDEAVQKLAKFFSSSGVLSFELKHKGTSKLNDHYRIGDLSTKKGKYRVTFFMSDEGKGMLIKQLRIEMFDED